MSSAFRPIILGNFLWMSRYWWVVLWICMVRYFKCDRGREYSESLRVFRFTELMKWRISVPRCFLVMCWGKKQSFEKEDSFILSSFFIKQQTRHGSKVTVGCCWNPFAAQIVTGWGGTTFVSKKVGYLIRLLANKGEKVNRKNGPRLHAGFACNAP